MTVSVVENQLSRSEEVIHWLDGLIAGLEIPANDRARVAASCLDVALEHQKAIHWTSSASLNGSAFSLVRLQFEAYVRGCWLLYSATDEELQAFLEDRPTKSLQKIIDGLERRPAFAEKILSGVKHESWKAMCSYTHTGLL